MKKLLFILLPLLFSQCADEKPQASTPSTSEKKEQTISEVQENQAPDTKQADNQKTATDKKGPGLNLWIGSAKAKKGEEVCIEVTTSDITGLLSMQYSLRWDPKILQYKGLKGFSIPTLDQNDFGPHRAKEGVLTAVWIDDTLKGENTKDGDKIYELCFLLIGESGQSTPVRFWSNPTPYEVIVLPEKIIPLTAHKGLITIE